MTKSAKVYVQVAVDMDANGKMMPREIAWENGSKFAIDRVLGVVSGSSSKSRRTRRSVYNTHKRPNYVAIF